MNLQNLQNPRHGSFEGFEGGSLEAAATAQAVARPVLPTPIKPDSAIAGLEIKANLRDMPLLL